MQGCRIRTHHCTRNLTLKMHPKLSLVALVLCALSRRVEPTAEIMKDLTLGFGEALKYCREESGLTEDKMEEFFHFWREDHRFEHRELGCAMKCMAKRFNLLTADSKMHHENTHKFITSFPNGEQLAHKMVEMIHNCEKPYEAEADDCWRIIHVAECFKQASIKAGIAPSMEMLMAEFIMESEDA